ncbi:MAG TPA: hypothetical protein VN461_11995 [Vicinamibacteria bacterium]|jgi:hypothetical protein|nr:hypothetical protein [Vicinamibacteria bacterium]
MAARTPELTTAGRGGRFRVFLLSPADCSGKRARLLQRPDHAHDLGRRIRRRGGAELGEVFSFVSSLYFRGKLAYARAFARPPRGLAGIHVITSCDGLRPPESPLRLADLRRYGRVPVDAEEGRYRRPLLRDLQALAPGWAEAEVILLGSIASPKYVELLTAVLGPRLFFPRDFVGRGDMSRGGLMLRCVQEERELPYVPLIGAPRRGPRPPRLPPATGQDRR